MKKKILLFISLLTIIFIPLTAYAATTYTYTRYCPLLSELDYIDESWAGKTYNVSSTSGQLYGLDVFCFHAINGDAGLCGGIGKSTVENDTVTEYLFNGNSNSANDITNNSGNKVTGTQLENLKDLMSNGYQFTTLNAIKSNKTQQKMYIAMQVLIWEVLEGGRTSFDYKTNGYAPNVYNGSGNIKSAYQTVIKPNPQIETYYNTIIRNVYDAQHPANASAFDTSSYTLAWNKSSKKYTKTVTGIGKYKTCVSNNDKVTVSVSGTNVTLTSTTPEVNATITCSYVVGTGTQAEDIFHYYAFGKNLCPQTNGCQNILYGKAIKKYSKSFNVSAESTKLEIIKVDESGKKISGSKFTLRDTADVSLRVTINGNASTPTVINRTATFTVTESTVPNGYSGISDFSLTINASTGKVTSCTNMQTSGSTITCLNGKVKITSANGKISMQVVNVPKSFKLMKVDENNTPVLGAGFEIRKTDNTKLKFKLVNGVYTYNTSGTVTVLQANNTNTYQIALLPVGEYNVVEVAVPYPYLMSKDESQRTTKIKISNTNALLVYNEQQKTYITSSEIVVKNYKSEVIINKTGLGKPLEGVKFLLYDVNKEEFIKSSMTKAGEYTYIQNQSTAENNNYVTDTSGNIKIYNLPVGTYYLREVETISPYVLPEGEAAYTKIKIDVTKEGLVINDSKTSKTINISNSPYTFNFYKVNEEGAYLSGGKFKIQKYNNEKNRYIDIKIKSVSNDGSYLSNADIF